MQERLRATSVAPLWYAVHCKTGRELYAAAALETLLPVTVYLPSIHQRSHGRIREVPFFPGYLFVAADLHAVAPSHIHTIPNVVRMVTFHEKPQPIDNGVVEYVRAQVTALDSGGTLLGHSFKLGETVRFKSGPFQGLEATFQGPMRPSDRVRVLLEFLGDLREFETGVERLERVHDQGRPERRTRGKGRVIRQ